MATSTILQNDLHRVTEDERRQVLTALERILASPVFSSSRRYPAMLRYIVEKTLNGHSDQLKERTIGIDVFGRSADYDTHEDAVVRISASEIRKRLAQFYQQESDHEEIEFQLPLGTYVPRITRQSDAITLHKPVAALLKQPSSESLSSPIAFRYGYLALALAICLLAGAVAILFYIRASRGNRQNDPVMSVWLPVLQSPDPVLISTGRPETPVVGPEAPDISIRDHILRPEFRVTTTTAEAIANVSGFLQIHKKPFRIHDAESNTLDDFHERPIVLVNGNDNKWTLQLMKGLRFQFIPYGRNNVAYICDAKNPSSQAWGVNFSSPFYKQTTDYAIVARFMSPTTQGPVVVIAGISSNGTEAAGEFIVEPDKLAELLAAAPPHWKGENFEAVLKVEVVGGNTGSSSVVASEFW